MVDSKPPMRITLEWQRDMVFSGRSGDTTLTVDGQGEAGPSPMHLVAFGLAGCMAVDVANILTRGRHPLTALSATLDAHRAAAQPPRFTQMDLRFLVTGAVPADAVQRAVVLSRDKYCSAWHSLRQDIELNVTFDIVN